MSKKTNIKILKFKRVFQVEVAQWTTVIDIDNDLKYLKYVKQRGEGPHRVSKFDEVSYKSDIFFVHQCIPLLVFPPTPKK